MRMTTFISLLIVIQSCTSSIEDFDTSEDSQLVIYSILEHQKPVTVEVLKTTSLFTQESNWVEDAEVILIKNGLAIDTLNYQGEAIYQSPVIVQANNDYQIQVNHATLLNAISKAETVLSPPKIKEILAQDSIDNMQTKPVRVYSKVILYLEELPTPAYFKRYEYFTLDNKRFSFQLQEEEGCVLGQGYIHYTSNCTNNIERLTFATSSQVRGDYLDSPINLTLCRINSTSVDFHFTDTNLQEEELLFFPIVNRPTNIEGGLGLVETAGCTTVQINF